MSRQKGNPVLFVTVHTWFICTSKARTTDTQWRHKSKISEKLDRCDRQNMLRPYLKIWDRYWIFGRAVKTISSLGVRSPWSKVCMVLRIKTSLIIKGWFTMGPWGEIFYEVAFEVIQFDEIFSNFSLNSRLKEIP